MTIIFDEETKASFSIGQQLASNITTETGSIQIDFNFVSRDDRHFYTLIAGAKSQLDLYPTFEPEANYVYTLNVSIYDDCTLNFHDEWIDATYIIESTNAQNAIVNIERSIPFSLVALSSILNVNMPLGTESAISQVFLSDGTININVQTADAYVLSLPFITINEKGNMDIPSNVRVVTQIMDWTNSNAECVLKTATYEVTNQIRYRSAMPIFDNLILADGVNLYAESQIETSGKITVCNSLKMNSTTIVLYFASSFDDLTNSVFEDFTNGGQMTLFTFPASTEYDDIYLELDEAYDNHIGFTNSTSILFKDTRKTASVYNIGFVIPVPPNEVFKTICVGIDPDRCPPDSDFETADDVNALKYLEFDQTSREFNFFIKDPIEGFQINISNINVSKNLAISSDTLIEPQAVHLITDNSRIISTLTMENVDLTVDVFDTISTIFDKMKIGLNCTGIVGLSGHLVLKIAAIDMHYSMMSIFDIEDHKSVTINLGHSLSAVYIGNSKVVFQIDGEPFPRPTASRSVISFQTDTPYLRYAPYEKDTVHMSNPVDLAWETDTTPTLEILGAWVEESPQNLHVLHLETVNLKVSSPIIPVEFEGITAINLIADKMTPVHFTGTVAVDKDMTINMGDNITKLQFNHLKMRGQYSMIAFEDRGLEREKTIDRVEVEAGASVRVKGFDITQSLIVHEEASVELEGVNMSTATVSLRMQVGCPDVLLGMNYYSTLPKGINVIPLTSKCGANAITDEPINLVCYLEPTRCQELLPLMSFSPSSVYWGVDKEINFTYSCIASQFALYMCLAVVRTENPRDVLERFMTTTDIVLIAVPSIIMCLGVIATFIGAIFLKRNEASLRDDLDEEEKYYYFSNRGDD